MTVSLAQPDDTSIVHGEHDEYCGTYSIEYKGQRSDLQVIVQG